MEYKEFSKYVGHLLSHNFVVDKEILLHATMGLVTESAEVLDLLKKHYAYDRPLSMNKVKDELADVLHYLTMACNQLGIDIEVLMNINHAKLSIRYPDGYSNEKANNRDLQAEEKVISGPRLCEACKSVDVSAEKPPCCFCYGLTNKPLWAPKVISKGTTDATKS